MKKGWRKCPAAPKAQLWHHDPRLTCRAGPGRRLGGAVGGTAKEHKRVSWAPSPGPAENLLFALIPPAPTVPNGIRRVNPAFPRPERAGTVLRAGRP